MEQEKRDLWTVWEWLDYSSKCVLRGDAVLLCWYGSYTGIEFSKAKDGNNWLNQAAKWVKQQRKEAQDG